MMNEANIKHGYSLIVRDDARDANLSLFWIQGRLYAKTD